MSEQASRHTLALNPLVGLRGKDLLDSAGIFFKAMVNEPRVAADKWLSFVGELTDIASGKSDRAPQPGDKRFADPTWKTSPLHGGLLKAYLAWGEALDEFRQRDESQHRRQGTGASVHDDPRRRAGADEQPHRQSRRDAQAYRFGRPKPGERPEELH